MPKSTYVLLLTGQLKICPILTICFYLPCHLLLGLRQRLPLWYLSCIFSLCITVAWWFCFPLLSLLASHWAEHVIWLTYHELWEGPAWSGLFSWISFLSCHCVPTPTLQNSTTSFQYPTSSYLSDFECSSPRLPSGSFFTSCNCLCRHHHCRKVLPDVSLALLFFVLFITQFWMCLLFGIILPSPFNISSKGIGTLSLLFCYISSK